MAAAEVTKTGVELVQDFIKLHDIKYVFGNPGTTETTFLAALTPDITTYMLCVHESSAVGIAAGYALITGKPSIVSLHTYPGLANGIFNMRNALLSGIPLLVINGTQDSRFLIHNPPLGGPNCELASTATKYQYEARSMDELTVAMQRCHLQAHLQPPGPVFLSIPMDFMQGSTSRITFKKTVVYEDVVTSRIKEVASILQESKGKLAIVADYAVGWSKSLDALSLLAEALEGHIYAAPFHVQGVLDPLHPLYKGQLPMRTGAIRDILSQYDTLLLIGEKIDAFTYDGRATLPPSLKVVQISPAAGQLGFDWPVDVAVVGDIAETMGALVREVGATKANSLADIVPDIEAVTAKYPATGPKASDAIILGVLKALDRETHVITEGSSEDTLVQAMANELGFRNVHYGPRGGGLGWAMPLSVGISLATGKLACCFVGDGGSLFSIHAIWTAAAHNIQAMFVCFVNHEYRLLKDLWVNVVGGNMATTDFVGLDFNKPRIDVKTIAASFGAKTFTIPSAEAVAGILSEVHAHKGPSFVVIEREHSREQAVEIERLANQA
eukprot:TRINITY_DN272_c0_g1_i1.p1 TRINITY_DN272_c0_g1~~TRINITY_DN272_c0_g1_i1.p1  ORF type:complete len:555 (-),score=134.59 TRINITY_DN272_c0_g1_i1:115-1779(-)